MIIEIHRDMIFIGIENIHLKDTKEWLYDTGITARNVYLNSFESASNPLQLGNTLGTSEYFEEFLNEIELKVGVKKKRLNNDSEMIYFYKH